MFSQGAQTSLKNNASMRSKNVFHGKWKKAENELISENVKGSITLSETSKAKIRNTKIENIKREVLIYSVLVIVGYLIYRYGAVSYTHLTLPTTPYV